MFGETNTDWNLHTLALMARAGLLRMIGTPYLRRREQGDWREIEIIDDGHLGEAVWRQRVEPVRYEGWIANKRNFDLIRDYLRDARCPAEIFEELYGAHRVGRACSRCSLRREDRNCRH